MTQRLQSRHAQNGRHRRRHRRWPWIALAVFVVFVVVPGIIGGPAPTSRPHEVPAVSHTQLSDAP